MTAIPRKSSAIFHIAHAKRRKKHMDFAAVEASQLRMLIWAIRQCDPADDIEFSGYIRAVINFFPLQMSAKDIAAHLLVNRLTVQRWAKGLSLPYPIPRSAYIAVLTSLLEDQYRELTGENFFVDDDVVQFSANRAAPPLDICTM